MKKEQFIIEGNQKFHGSVRVCGAKNGALPIFFAAILGNEDITLHNYPALSDTKVTCEIFNHMGGKVKRDLANNKITLQPQFINNYECPYELAKKMRASFWALAPLLAKFGKAKVALPGGCEIGSRPVDMHIDALKKLGAQIEFAQGDVIASAPQGLKGCRIFFDNVSVGATISAITAAVLAQGTTHLENAACEPEVSGLCEFLVSMGAKISGIGSRELTIEGVTELKGTEYTIIPDRIEAGSYLIAAVCSRAKVEVTHCNAKHLESILDKLRDAGAIIKVSGSTISCDMEGRRPKAVNITTAPYPGIPTDMQAQFTILNCVAEGVSTITETIFENRFMHVSELQRMGALIRQKGNTIYITGVEQLSGAEVKSTDLRASIALVIAGCTAKGTTILNDIYHIDRGYAHIEEQLAHLGCTITRRQVEEH